MNVTGVPAEDEHGGLVNDGAVVIPTKIDNSLAIDHDITEGRKESV